MLLTDNSTLWEQLFEFGRELIKTKDLDPVYCYLADSNYPPEQLKRWLVAYSMFYHAGVANQLSTLTYKDFWQFVNENLATLPRGEERRHYRGAAAQGSVDSLSRYEPERIVDFWYQTLDFQSVLANVRKLPLYGNWIAFKLADMGERVLKLPISFDNCELDIYHEPKAAVAILIHGDEKVKVSKQDISETVDRITSTLNQENLLAPPWYDRPLNIQEAETILCKFKSHLHGHYPVGKDIAAVEKAIKWQK